MVSDKLADVDQATFVAPLTNKGAQSPSQITVSFDVTNVITGSTVTRIESIEIHPRASVIVSW